MLIRHDVRLSGPQIEEPWRRWRRRAVARMAPVERRRIADAVR